MNLQELIMSITPPDSDAAVKARTRWDSLGKPLGSLGLLESSVVDMAALRGTDAVAIDKPVLLVLCADHGVVAQGVSQTDSSVTAAVARALAAGDSTVCHMAQVVQCPVKPVDLGILDFPETAGVKNCRIRNGTADMSVGPAMTRFECVQAVEVGISLAETVFLEGYDLILTGEMGIGNTTAASALLSVLLDLPLVTVTGRGAGLSDEGLWRKIDILERSIYVNHPDSGDVIDLLSKVGGLEIAGLCGLFLGGAYFGIPVVIDGVISATAALCAKRLCRESRKAMLASHVSGEPAGQAVLDALGLRPLITAGMRLGEGSGAVAALPLLQMALAVYNSGHTFEALGIEAYTPQGGGVC